MMVPALIPDLLLIAGQGVLRASWLALLIVPILLLVEWSLPQLTPRGRSWLWRLLYVRLAVELVIPVGWSLPVIPESWSFVIAQEAVEERAVAASRTHAEDIIAPLVNVSADMAGAVEEKPQVSAIETATSEPLSAAAIATGRQIDEPRNVENAVNSSVPTNRWWMIVALVVWGLGVLTRLGVAGRQIWGLYRLRKSATVVRSPTVLREVARLSRVLGLQRVPRVVSAPNIPGPMVFGYRRGCIVWPATWLDGLATALLSSRLRTAMAHEMAHLARRDLWWNALAAVVETALWFHPCVWRADGRYRQAQESACDQLALARAGGDPAQFAELLLSLAQRPRAASWNPAVVPLFSAPGKHLLRERLQQMRSMPLSFYRRVCLIPGLALALSVAVCPWSFSPVQAADDNVASADEAPPTTNKKATQRRGGTKSGSSTRSSGSGDTNIKPGDDVHSGDSGSGGGSGGASFGAASSSSRIITGGSASGSAGGSGSGGAGGTSVGSSSKSGDKSSKGESRAQSDPDLNGSRRGNGMGNKRMTPPPRVGAGKSGGTSRSSSVTEDRSSSEETVVAYRREVNDDGEEIRVSVQEKLRDIQIRQSDDDGIEVKIRPTKKNPDKSEITATAATPEELKETNAEAFAVYQKYLAARRERDLQKPNFPPNFSPDFAPNFPNNNKKLPPVNPDLPPLGESLKPNVPQAMPKAEEERPGQAQANEPAEDEEAGEEADDDVAGDATLNPAERLLVEQLRRQLQDESLPGPLKKQIQEMIRQIEKK